MVREAMEQACAQVDEAKLLGFARGECIEGHEKGPVHGRHAADVPGGEPPRIAAPDARRPVRRG